MSPRSITSNSTVRTVDDVMSVMELSISKNASLSESKKFVRQITTKDGILRAQSIDELESITGIVSPITSNPNALILAMSKSGAMIGGAQATSFFYPICQVTDCPYIIFCHSETADEFINIYRSTSGVDLIEDLGSTMTTRAVHFRKSINGMKKPASIVIYVSKRHPLESILSLKNSYEQTAISAVGAICFWPKLQSQGLYRVFDLNPGLTDYPKGNVFYQMVISPGKKAITKKPMTQPSIYNRISAREEIVVFKNACNIDNVIYNQKLVELQNIVYCVFNTSSRYLGHTADMK